MKYAATLVLFATTLAIAAPVPKPKPKKLADVFGELVDTPGVACEMTRQGELRVGVSMGATTAADVHSVARPFVTKKVEGFQVTVRVTHAPPAGKVLTAVGGERPTVSAGIALYPPDKPAASITFLQQHIKEGDAWKSDFYSRTQYNEDVYQDSWRPGKKLDRGPVYLRLTRRGNEFTSAWSYDGKEWTPAAGQGQFAFRAGVLIGLAAAHNTNTEYGVVFDHFVLKPLTKEKK